MISKYLCEIREKRPIIHNITNYVTVNDVANMILACGGSPIMSDESDEVEDITSICGGLNINIGTLHKSSIAAMFIAGRKANQLKHPVLLDPVGAGASRLRTETAQNLIEQIKFSVIRGNMSEIKALAIGSHTTNGVDADISDKITDDNFDNTIQFVKNFSAQTGSIIVITGAIDLVADKNKCYIIRNGHTEMSRITGTGCQLSGMITAFITANPDNMLEACVSAVCTMGLAGEIAYSQLTDTDGNSTYRNKIIDAVYNMTSEILERGAKYEVR